MVGALCPAGITVGRPDNSNQTVLFTAKVLMSHGCVGAMCTQQCDCVFTLNLITSNQIFAAHCDRFVCLYGILSNHSTAPPRYRPLLFSLLKYQLLPTSLRPQRPSCELARCLAGIEPDPPRLPAHMHQPLPVLCSGPSGNLLPFFACNLQGASHNPSPFTSDSLWSASFHFHRFASWKFLIILSSFR